VREQMIRLENVSKDFKSASGEVNAVRNVNLTIEKGSIYGIIGLSGAGKSTLVRCMNLLESPTEGRVFLGDTQLTGLNPRQLRRERKKIGMIFQQFHLLEQSTALKNVCYPLEVAGISRKEAKKKAEKLLELVGLESKRNSYPSQLSGGQKQRVAIARALATDPQVLLCDEATSALDPNTTCSILELLEQINASLGVTIVLITHEMKVIEQICTHVAVLDQGSIVEEGLVKAVFYHPESLITQVLIGRKAAGELNAG